MHASAPRKPGQLHPIGWVQQQQSGTVETQDFLPTGPCSGYRGTISGFVHSGLPEHSTIAHRKSHHASLRSAHLNNQPIAEQQR
jgi:hypothetical protein